MRVLGYVEGGNLKPEERYSDGDLALLQAQATGLAQLNVDILVTGSTPATRAARKGKQGETIDPM